MRYDSVLATRFTRYRHFPFTLNLSPLTSRILPIALFLGVAIAILGPMLLPGYILTLDMVWPEELTMSWSVYNFNNAQPLNAVLAALALVLPSWVVQKVMLVSLFFLLGYLPYRFLPFITGAPGRIYAGLLYVLNPFVYSRMLAGHWMVLLGYALLPLLVYALYLLSERRDARSALILAIALLLIGCVSPHFLYLGAGITAFWLAFEVMHAGVREGLVQARVLIRYSLFAALLVCTLSSYWLVPALMRDAPIEARFDIAHFEAFAAQGNGFIPAPLNVLTLGGFWGEGYEWGDLFLWPQAHYTWWLVAALVLSFTLYGLWLLIRARETRRYGVMLLLGALVSYVLALGADGGVPGIVNEWLYAHIPGWAGLRDSHKIAGILALVYALAGGIAVSHVHALLRGRAALRTLCMAGAFMVPVFFGMYEWGGFHGQLAPVWYPTAWYEARAALSDMPADEKVLVLPWHGYIAVPFADQRIMANPAPRFFGTERVLASRSVELGDVYDQEADPAYRTLDDFVRSLQTLGEQEVADGLAAHKVHYLLVIANTGIEDQEAWLSGSVGPQEAHGEPITDARDTSTMRSLLRLPHETVQENDVLLYRFMK